MGKYNYIYCPNCGYEDFDFDYNLVISGHYANGFFYYCPKCSAETSIVEEEENE